MVLILAMVFVVGLNNYFVLRYNLNSHFEQLRNSLKVIAQTAALAVDVNTLQQIPLTREGVFTAAYRKVSETLGRVRDLNTPIQYIYILSKTGTLGKLQFIVDTEPRRPELHKNKGTARPGDFYDARKFQDMLAGFVASTADREIQRDPWGVTLSGYSPIIDMDDGKTVAILGVDILADDIAKMQNEIKRRTWIVLFAGILACSLLGVLISGSVSYPIRKLVEGTRQLARDNLDYRVKVRSRDEIGELADSFNKMAGSLCESRKRLENYFFKVTQSLVRALEAKDPYTQGHSERVANLTRKIALEMKMNGERADLIACVAELHDIGKLLVNGNILKKNTKLDSVEWNEMKDHPVTGEKILAPVLDEDLLRVIRSHHERVDGEGYPDGLKGDEIDLPSQIVSVADAYDAMTSARPYRKSLPPEDAIKEIKRASGTQFREDVVNAFLLVIGRSDPQAGRAI